MAHIRRASVSSTLSNRSASPLVFVAASNADTDEWVKSWRQVTVQGTDHMSHAACLSFLDWFPHISQISSNLQWSQLMQTKAWRPLVMCVDFVATIHHPSRVHISSLDPLIIWRPVFGHTSKGFLLSRSIRCIYPPYPPCYPFLPLLSTPTSTRS